MIQTNPLLSKRYYYVDLKSYEEIKLFKSLNTGLICDDVIDHTTQIAPEKMLVLVDSKEMSWSTGYLIRTPCNTYSLFDFINLQFNNVFERKQEVVEDSKSDISNDTTASAYVWVLCVFGDNFSQTFKFNTEADALKAKNAFYQFSTVVFQALP